MSKYFLIWLIYAFLQEDPTVPVWREFIHFDGKNCPMFYIPSLNQEMLWLKA